VKENQNNPRRLTAEEKKALQFEREQRRQAQEAGCFGLLGGSASRRIYSQSPSRAGWFLQTAASASSVSGEIFVELPPQTILQPRRGGIFR